jgi:hypothetical protein
MGERILERPRSLRLDDHDLPPPASLLRLTYLQRLEAESIHIMREVVAQVERPVMLYSVGKDSSVMLRLALKAFHPGRPPFPFLHVDTTWKFREMYTTWRLTAHLQTFLSAVGVPRVGRLSGTSVP